MLDPVLECHFSGGVVGADELRCHNAPRCALVFVLTVFFLVTCVELKATSIPRNKLSKDFRRPQKHDTNVLEN